MKRTFLFARISIITVFLLSTTIAQEKVDEGKQERKDYKINVLNKIDGTAAISDKIEFKNENGNAIIIITDEGSNIGSITLPPGFAPSITKNKLYNHSGTLKFDGLSLGGGAQQINDLSDAKYDGESLFLGFDAGKNDDAGLSDGTKNFNTSLGVFSMFSNSTGSLNTAVGNRSLYFNTTGYSNTAHGYLSQYSNTSGYENTSIGNSSLAANTTGFRNTAVGFSNLISNTIGSNNTAVGNHALYSNTVGKYNTANGSGALYHNTRGLDNTAFGYLALTGITSQSENTAIGSKALANSQGDNNVAMGYEALYGTTGDANTAVGHWALRWNAGSSNTAIGQNALHDNQNGYVNVGIGAGANFWNSNGYGNVIIGSGAGHGTVRHDKSLNIFIGYRAGFYETGSNKLYIENTDSDKPLIGGDFSVDEIYLNGKVGIGTMSPGFNLHIKDNSASELLMVENTNTAADTDGMIIKVGPATPTDQADFIIFHNGNGGTVGTIDGNGSGGINYNTTSDARLKTNIVEFNNAMETLSQIGIKKYERIANPGIEEIGVIAQELQKIYPQAVSGSPDSDVKTDPMMVDYSKLTPLLVKGMQEQEQKISSQEVRIKELEEKNAESMTQKSDLEKRLAKLESLLNGKRFTSASN